MTISFARRQAALLSALAFIPVLLLYGACSPDAEKAGGRTVHVSVTDKGAVQHFLNRFAMDEGQLVVTSAPLAANAAKQHVAVKEDQGERLYAIELNPREARTTLPGEKVRIGNFAIIAVPDGQGAHELIGDHKLYAEALSLAETHAPSFRRTLPGRIGKGGGGLPPFLFDEQRGMPSEVVDVMIDRQYLEQKAKEISGALPVTIAGQTVTIAERRSATGRSNARAFLRQEYEAMGFTVSQHAYGSNGGVNFIAEKPGSDADRFVLLTAHLDSVGNAGADDDGAGTVSVLTIVKAIAERPLKVGVRVVGFDQEELGLLGSKAYAKYLSDNNRLGEVIGVLNVEMTGYDSDNDGAFHAIHCNENTSAQITARVSAAVSRQPINLRIVNACTNRSDHAAFWVYDVPAIVVSQNFFGGDSNPCYHQACDRVDRLNFDYLANITKVLAMTVADWVVAE